MDAPQARLPPHSLEAEQGVLGAILRDNTTADDVFALLTEPTCFYLDAHQRIYKAMRTLYQANKAVDLVTLGEQLHQNKHVEDIGGYGYLAQIYDNTPAAAHAIYYAKIVQDKWILRRLIYASNEIGRNAYSPSGPAQEIASEAAKLVCNIEAHDEAKVSSAQEAADATADMIDRIYTQGATGLMTGMRDIDLMTSGLHPGELVLLGARPSVGKTLYALTVTRHVAKRGKIVFFASLEQSKEELMIRVASAEAGVNGHRVRGGMASPGELESFRTANLEAGRWGMHIDDAASQSCSRILANARRVQRQQGLDLICIDYLGLIQSDERRNQNREQEVSTISRRLKLMARELKVPLLCLAQLNRGPEARADGEPKLSDFRDSGAQEQDADVVMMLWASEFPNVVNVKIAKQRNGPVGTRKLFCDHAIQRFSNYAGV